MAIAESTTGARAQSDVRGKRRSLWSVTAREARQHATMLAAVQWAAAILLCVAAPFRALTGAPRPAVDFLHFYTFGAAARLGQIPQAYDWHTFHRMQTALVPGSAQYLYPPVYPPQVALMFWPFSVVPFDVAAAVWVAGTIAVYAGIVWWTWRSTHRLRGQGALVAAAAAAFPPFWHLVLDGQITILILGACFIAWLALERRWHFMAGLALGFLAIKPQFGLVFAAIVVLRRDWRMAAGAVVALAIQAALVTALWGIEPFRAYAATLPDMVRHADVLEPKPFESHSLRSLTRLLPDWAGVPVWVASVAVVLWKSAEAWATDAPLSVRFGVVLIAAVLVNPHLIVYDATLLVLPLVWFAAWLEDDATDRERSAYYALVYALFITFLIPTASLIGIQLSVFVMLGLFWRMARRAITKGCSLRDFRLPPGRRACSGDRAVAQNS